MTVQTYTEWTCERCGRTDRRSADDGAAANDGKPTAPTGWRAIIIADPLTRAATTAPVELCGPCVGSISNHLARLPEAEAAR